MAYPIVNVKTHDGLLLHGLLSEPIQPAKTIDIHLHGAGGNFCGNSYFEGLTHRLAALGMAYLSTNNRGAGVYELESGYNEIFLTRILILCYTFTYVSSKNAVLTVTFNLFIFNWSCA